MAIDRITAAQFYAKFQAALLSRTTAWDTAFGPVPDVIGLPNSAVLEDQNNNRLRRVSLLLSLANSDEFTEEDLDEVVYNEGLIRPQGDNASVVLTFSRNTQFGVSESGTIARGWPIGTSIDESTGQAVTFVTTESRTKTNAVATLDTNTNAIVYKVKVPAICLITGTAGLVGPNRINRPLRPLAGYTSVTNEAASVNGRDKFTNDELIELYFLAVASRQLSVPQGSEFHVTDTFPAVEDVHEVFGVDPLLTRGDAGAVDSFVISEDELTTSDDVTFLGVGQKLILSTPPAVTILSVVGTSGSVIGETFVEGEDFEVALDTSGLSGSVRARDGIKFLASADPMPEPGDVITISYTYNQVVRDLQDDAADLEVEVEGRDILFRLGARVDIFLAATLTVRDGFSFSDIQDAVEALLISEGDAFRLGDRVEGSDIQATVRRLTGVDNFVITRLSRTLTGEGTADIDIDGDEYARFDINNIIIS